MPNPRALAFALLLLATPTSAAQPAPPIILAAAATQQDTDACSTGDAARAIPACTRIIGNAEVPADDRAEALRYRGDAYLGQKDPARAVADYSEAIRLAPQNAATRASRAIAYALLKDSARAAIDYTIASRLDPALVADIAANSPEFAAIAAYARANPPAENLLRQAAPSPAPSPPPPRVAEPPRPPAAPRTADTPRQPGPPSPPSPPPHQPPPPRAAGQGDGWIGVRIQPVTDLVGEALGLKPARGALVAGTQEGPARAAGIEPRDVILRFDGEDIKLPRDLSALVARTPVGNTVEVVIWRGGAEIRRTLTIGRLGAARAAPAAPAAPAPSAETHVLGLTLAPLGAELRQRFRLTDGITRGAAVTAVEAGSQAARNGIKVGDVVIEVGDIAVLNAAHAAAVIETQRRAGQRAVLLRVTSPQGAPRFVALAIEGEGNGKP